MPNSPDVPGLAFHELLAYTAAENERWHRWFAAHPALLDRPFAEPPLASIRQLIRHIAFVEHRYAALTLGEQPPAATGGNSDDADTLFAYLADGRRAFEETVARASDDGLDRIVDFMTLTAGQQRASARKMIAHGLMHGIRHWAQLATVLRQEGERTDWSHDFLFSTALA